MELREPQPKLPTVSGRIGRVERSVKKGLGGAFATGYPDRPIDRKLFKRFGVIDLLLLLLFYSRGEFRRKCGYQRVDYYSTPGKNGKTPKVLRKPKEIRNTLSRSRSAESVVCAVCEFEAGSKQSKRINKMSEAVEVEQIIETKPRKVNP